MFSNNSKTTSNLIYKTELNNCLTLRFYAFYIAQQHYRKVVLKLIDF